MLGDDGSGEVVPRSAGADGDLVNLLDECLLEAALPERAGDVDPSESRALLARVLERSADGLDDTGLDVGGGVVEVEVLSA